MIITDIGYPWKLRRERNLKMKVRNVMKKSVIMLVGLILVANLSACQTYTSGDNKCDICGKRATHTIGSEEYCGTHYKKATNWYVKKALDR